MVFWSDVREERIYRAPIDSGYPDQALLTQAVVTADGLAVDWVYSHLYWTDAGADTISGLEWDGNINVKSKLKSSRLVLLRFVVANKVTDDDVKIKFD